MNIFIFCASNTRNDLPGKYLWEREMKKLDFSLKNNGIYWGDVRIGYKDNIERNQRILTPIFLITRSSVDVLQMKGT